MKNILYIIAFIFSVNAVADPFFGENNSSSTDSISQKISTNSVEKISEILTACKPSENHFMLNIPTEFEKLKLVGIVEINQQFRALFVDEKDHLFDFKENEIINQQQVEIKNINIKSVTYINWALTTDCNNPHQITLKL